MRIITYNILNGGEGRADPLAEVLIAQQADVVCLVECTVESVLQRIASRMQMDVAVATAGRDSVALLSRWPILESIDHAAVRDQFTGSLLEAIVQAPDGVDLPIGVLHLSAKATEEREAKRLVEIDHVLAAFAPHRQAGRPHVLAGDFNANSPTQRIDPDHCKPATKQAWAENGGHIPRRVIERLLAAGYVNTLKQMLHESADEMTSFTTHWPGQRVDYIFSFGISPQTAWIERDRLATYASDHYPVGSEFALTTATESIS